MRVCVCVGMHANGYVCRLTRVLLCILFEDFFLIKCKEHNFIFQSFCFICFLFLGVILLLFVVFKMS